MTEVDLGLALLVVLGAAYGAWAGAVKQIAGLAAWCAAILAPYGLAAPVARALSGPLGAPYPVAFLFAALSLSGIAYVVARLIWSAALRLVFARRPPKKKDGEESDPRDAHGMSSSNRVVGSFVGAGKMAVLLWILLSVVALVAIPFESRGVQLRFSDSALYGVCKRHNLLGVLFHERFVSLHKALARSGKKAPKGAHALEELQKDPRFQEIAKDEAIRKAIAEGDALALARSPQLLSLITDGAMMERVAGVVAQGTAELEALKN